MWSDETFFFFFFFFCTCRLSGRLSLHLLNSVTHVLFGPARAPTPNPPPPLHLTAAECNMPCFYALHSLLVLLSSHCNAAVFWHTNSCGGSPPPLPSSTSSSPHRRMCCQPPRCDCMSGKNHGLIFLTLLPAHFSSLMGDPWTASTCTATQLSLCSELDVALQRFIPTCIYIRAFSAVCDVLPDLHEGTSLRLVVVFAFVFFIEQ